MLDLRRRQFIRLIGGAVVAWPLAAHGQRSTMLLIGFLSSRSPDDTTHLLAGFRQGLADAGFIEHHAQLQQLADEVIE
jgi:putative tryptophan/tyrosine transport system substrate-binding protein